MIAFVTSDKARELDEDMAPLCGAMLHLGVPHDVVAWDDPSVDWSSYSVVIVRSTWDYHTRIDEFLAWVDHVSSVTRLCNSRAVIRWNTDKRYLADLASVGVPVVPTSFISSPEEMSSFAARSSNWEDVVVKPTVSAGSNDTARHNSFESAAAHMNNLLGRGKVVMLQPYQKEIDELGETAMVYMAGEFSHAFYKGPILADNSGDTRNSLFVEETIRAHSATSAQRAIGDRLMTYMIDSFGEAPLYARVDVVPGVDGPLLLELEVTEPSLYFSTAEGSVERFAELCAGLG